MATVTVVSSNDPVARFDALPRRLFLDSSTLQTLLDYGAPSLKASSRRRAIAPGPCLASLKTWSRCTGSSSSTSGRCSISCSRWGVWTRVVAKADPRYTRWACRAGRSRSRFGSTVRVAQVACAAGIRARVVSVMARERGALPLLPPSLEEIDGLLQSTRT